MAFISSWLPSKKITLSMTYKTLEVLGVEVKINNNDVLIIWIYRPPKAIGENYYSKLEDELPALIMWATQEKQTVTKTGDLNLNRINPSRRECRILIDLEEVYGLECLIKDPKHITNSSETLIDVILTNNPDLFEQSGVFFPEISDHGLFYGLMKENVHQYQSKIIAFRSTKNLDVEKLNENLPTAPWHVSDVFDDIDDTHFFWELLFKQILDEHLPQK